MRYDWTKGTGLAADTVLWAVCGMEICLLNNGESSLEPASQHWGPLAWPHVPFFPPISLAAITETFLSSLPALQQASPLIPAECVECWTTELSGRAASGKRGGNESTWVPTGTITCRWAQTYRENICHLRCRRRETLPYKSSLWGWIGWMDTTGWGWFT